MIWLWIFLGTVLSIIALICLFTLLFVISDVKKFGRK